MKSSNSGKACERLVHIGNLTGAHGVKGVVKVHPFAETPDLFAKGETLLLETPDGKKDRRKIKWVAPHGRVLRMQLENITDRDQAKALTGTRIYVEKTALPRPEDDAYYWFDLVGLFVYSKEDHLIGILESIIPTGSNDVYVVRDKKGGRETLIPAIASVVLDIDLDQKTMIVDLPEGL